MDKEIKMVDLSRTAAALAAYDRAADTYHDAVEALSNREAIVHWAAVDAAARAVGGAFGEDTKAFNNPDTCAQCVRPGSRVPAIGQELSFVRRMVARWEVAC